MSPSDERVWPSDGVTYMTWETARDLVPDVPTAVLLALLTEFDYELGTGQLRYQCRGGIGFFMQEARRLHAELMLEAVVA